MEIKYEVYCKEIENNEIIFNYFNYLKHKIESNKLIEELISPFILKTNDDIKKDILQEEKINQIILLIIQK